MRNTGQWYFSRELSLHTFPYPVQFKLEETENKQKYPYINIGVLKTWDEALKIGLLTLNHLDVISEQFANITTSVDEIFIWRDLFNVILDSSIDFDKIIIDQSFSLSVKSLILDAAKCANYSIPDQWYIVISQLKLLFPNISSIRVLSLDVSVVNMEVLKMLNMNKKIENESEQKTDNKSLITSIDCCGGYSCNGITKCNDVIVYYENQETKFFNVGELIVSCIWTSNQVAFYDEEFIVFRGFLGVALKDVYELDK